MKMWPSPILAILLIAIGCHYCGAQVSEPSQGPARKRVIFCYVDLWAALRSRPIWRFTHANINSSYCTHVVFAFAEIGDRPWSIGPYPMYMNTTFQEIKWRNPNLKMLLAVGDIFYATSGMFSMMAGDEVSRQEFVTNAVTFLRENELDGLDINWNTPTLGPGGIDSSGNDEDTEYHALLLKDLRSAFDEYSEVTGKRLLLTAVVTAEFPYGYDVPRLNEYLDYISLVTFVAYNGFDDVFDQRARTRYLSAIYKNLDDDTPDFSVSTLASIWIRKGVSTEKLLLGLPLFGRVFRLKEIFNTGLNAPTIGVGTLGNVSRATDLSIRPGYFQTCRLCQNDDYTCRFDAEALELYAYGGGLWINFETVYTLQFKMTWLIDNNFTGAMVWSLDSDDFDDTCKMGKYPLMKAISQCLLKNINCYPGNKPSAQAQVGSIIPNTGTLTPDPSITFPLIAVVAVSLLFCY